MVPDAQERSASYQEPQVPDYNLHKLGDLLGPVLDKGDRQRSLSLNRSKKVPFDNGRLRSARYPTNSERMNRALRELGTSAFKIHMLLWQWRGAPAKGLLPYFTIHSLSKFCALTRPTIRVGVRELVRKGWISKQGYNKHHKNELYRLIAIRDVPEIHPRPRGPVAAAPGGADGTVLPRPGATI